MVGAVGTTVLAAPVLPRLGAPAVTVYSCVLAGLMLLALTVQDGLATGVDVVRVPTWVELGAAAYLAIMVPASSASPGAERWSGSGPSAPAFSMV